MIYGMLYLMIRKLFRFRVKLLEWIHFNYLIQVLVLVVLWGYIFLLNWPVPSFRATCMISILVMGYSLGHVQVPVYSLGLTSFILLLSKLVMIYDLTFKLSFLAVFLIILFLSLYPSIIKSDKLILRVGKYGSTSLIMTGAVMLRT